MTIEQIRTKARELHAKTRRELQANTAVPLFAAGLCGIGVWVKDDPINWGSPRSASPGALRARLR